MPAQLLSGSDSAWVLLLLVGLAVLVLIAVVAILRAVNAGSSKPTRWCISGLSVGLLDICGMVARCLLLSV
jgi:hypothetical protein